MIHVTTLSLLADNRPALDPFQRHVMNDADASLDLETQHSKQEKERDGSPAPR